MPGDAQIEPALKSRLGRLHLRPEHPDADTLVLRGVPADPDSFSKPRTNLLIKRLSGVTRSVLCVDEDLEYLGADYELSCAFAAAAKQEGWRVLTFGGRLEGDLMVTLDYALSLLGAGDAEGPAKPPAGYRAGGLLANLAENLSVNLATGYDRFTLYRDEKVEQAAGCVLSWKVRIPLIVGHPGVGKTNLLHGIARRLGQSRFRGEVLSVNLGVAMAGLLLESEREGLLRSLLREAWEAGIVLALEQAEWAILGVPRGLVLLRDASDRGARLMATSTPEYCKALCAVPLAPRIETIMLSEFCDVDAGHVLEAMRDSIAAHHGVTIDADVVNAAVEQSMALPGHLPGKAIALLDAAAARASLTGGAAVTQLDIYLASSRMLDKEW